MNLFTLNKETYEVEISPEALLLTPFKKVAAKDRSINKITAKSEFAYIYFFADVKSNYQVIDDAIERSNEIIKDLQLPKEWKPDKRIKDAIELYETLSTTINETIYASAIQSAKDVSSYLRDTKKHLAAGLDITKITNAIKAMPQIMKDLKAAEKELILEQKEASKKSGSKTFNPMEDGNY